MPPPIPINPDKNPIIAPINNDRYMFDFFYIGYIKITKEEERIMESEEVPQYFL